MLDKTFGCVVNELSGPTGENPTPAHGQTTEFKYSNAEDLLDDRLPTGLVATIYEVSGNLVQSGGTGVRIFFDAFVRCLVDSIQIQNARHGTPIREAHFKGASLPARMFVAGGYEQGDFVRGVFPAGNGTYPFKVEIPIYHGYGATERPDHLHPLTWLYKPAMLKVKTPALAVLTALSPGASFTALKARCSALVLPMDKIPLGPFVEHVRYETPVGGKNFHWEGVGLDSGLANVENGSGMLWEFFASSANALGGSFASNNITHIGSPPNGIPITAHPQTLIAAAKMAMGGSRIHGSVADEAASIHTDFSGYPFALGTSNPAGAGNMPAGLLGIPLTSPGKRALLSKLRAHGGNRQCYVDGTSISGNHVLETSELKRLNSAGKAKLLREMVREGFFQKVFPGARSGKVVPLGLGGGGGETTSKKARFLPEIVVPV